MGRDPVATWRRQPVLSSIFSLCQLQKQFLLLLVPLAGILEEQINIGSRWAQLIPADGFMVLSVANKDNLNAKQPGLG